MNIFGKTKMKKVSVISGGTNGLGLKIAEHMVRSGRNVLVLGRRKENISLAKSRLNKLAENNFAEAQMCNIGSEDEVKRVGDWIRKNNLTVEYLFNNAGVGLFIDAEKSSSELIDKVFEANLKGMILLTTEILRLTPENEELTIVNIMSTSALTGRTEETIYCAAKWGARGYTEALRAEYKGKKRNIIAVYPGGMKTDFWKIPGQTRDISGFMDPAEVADKIVNSVLVSKNMLVSDLTINRK
jgi:uncharacterized protein